MKLARLLLAIAATGILCSSVAHARPQHQGEHHKQRRPDSAVQRAEAERLPRIPSFSGGCNPALHVRFGWCPSREYMWNHMWDEGKPMPWNNQYLNR